MDIFGIGMVAMQAMIFNSTRKYYLNECEGDHTLSFDNKQLKTDFNELREVYP